MPKPTQKSLMEAGLKACGWKVDPTARTSKYTVYVKDGENYKLLVGRSGALRKQTTTVARSISLTEGKRPPAYRKVGEHASSYTSAEQAQAAYEQFLITE